MWKTRTTKVWTTDVGVRSRSCRFFVSFLVKTMRGSLWSIRYVDRFCESGHSARPTLPICTLSSSNEPGCKVQKFGFEGSVVCVVLLFSGQESFFCGPSRLECTAAATATTHVLLLGLKSSGFSGLQFPFSGLGAANTVHDTPATVAKSKPEACS